MAPKTPDSPSVDFIADQLARFEPATASGRYRALQTFFCWAVAEGGFEASPMATMRRRQTGICGLGRVTATRIGPSSGSGWPAL